MGIVLAFFALCGVICFYGFSVKADFPTVMTEDIGELVKKRDEALEQALFFAELSKEEIDTTWSDMYIESILQ